MPKNAVIVGMPRSGTSLTAAILVSKGYYVGSNRLSYFQHGDEDNPFGYFEADNLIDRNIEVLRKTGFYYANTWMFGELLQSSIDQIPHLTASDVDRQLVEAYREHAPWVWKDPRLCFTLRYWWPLLDGSRTGVLLLRRDWLDVYHSFRRMGWCAGGSIARARVKKLVEQHLGTAETTIEALSIPFVEVDYAEFMEMPHRVAKRIGEFFELDLSVQDLNVRPELNHSRIGGKVSTYLRIQLRKLPRAPIKRLEKALPRWVLAKIFPERKYVSKDGFSPSAGVTTATLALPDTAGAAEQDAARCLGVEPIAVAVAARRMWRRSLSEEIEQRLAAEMSDDGPSVDANNERIRMTEKLIQELSPLVQQLKAKASP